MAHFTYGLSWPIIFLATNMNISSTSDDDFVSPSGAVCISRGSTIVHGQDGSKHIVPRLNKKALQYLQDKNTGSKKCQQKCATKTASTNLHKINSQSLPIQRKKHNAASTSQLTVKDGSNSSATQGNESAKDTPQKSFTRRRGIAPKKTSPEANMAISLDSIPANLNLLTIFQIVCLVTNQSNFHQFLRDRRLLSSSESCKKCEVEMSIRNRSNTLDGIAYYCGKCKTTKSIRAGSFFSKTKLSLTHSFFVMYSWSTGLQGYQLKHLIPNSPIDTVYDYFSFCRDVCLEYFKNNPVIFEPSSELQCELQIDESVFGKQCKYNRGRGHKNYWLFGISEPKSHKCALFWVNQRDRATLSPLIETHVPKTASVKIVSDGWASYEHLSSLGYKHSVVVHKDEFVNSEGEHTNSVESVWSQLKNWIRSMHGMSFSHREGYIAEFQFRYNIAKGSRANCFHQLISEIPNVYPV